MICQVCGIEAPTKYVSLHQNIGALVMRFSKSVQGNLCKSCIHKYFWQFTAVNLFLGWWGMISFFVTPFLILNNFVRYLLCLGMEPVPFDAAVPDLTEEAVENLTPHTERLFERLNAGDDFETVVQDTAERAMVTPGQVVLYLQAVIAAAEQRQPAQT